MQYRDTKYQIESDGRVINSKTGKTLTPVVKPTGYAEIRLCINGKQICLSHHRIVYEAFNGSIPKGMQVNHLNGVKTDNRVSNLEVVTPSENQFKRLNLRRGERVNTAKLTEKSVRDIKASKTPSKMLAKQFGVSVSAIIRIKSGKTWSHI